jgi:hypothetical protein
MTANPAKKGESEVTGGIRSRFTYRNMLMNSTRAVHQRRKAFRYADIEEMLLQAIRRLNASGSSVNYSHNR